MIETKCLIKDNIRVCGNIFRMDIALPEKTEIRPGQFFNFKIPGFFLRRPISVCDCDPDTVSFIYRTVGNGTSAMSEMKSGDEADALFPLGNGYDISCCGISPLIIGGGLGIPPLYYLAKEIIRENRAKKEEIRVILGFSTKNEIFLKDEFASLGVELVVTTADGSYGRKGFVTDAMGDEEHSFVYSCGPLAMMKAVEMKMADELSGQFSLEERMGCGFGACMGCSLKTRNGTSRVCREGPVFRKEEIIWEDLK